jgi:hypothetical protein
MGWRLRDLPITRQRLFHSEGCQKLGCEEGDDTVYMIGWIQLPIHAVLYDSGGVDLPERHVREYCTTVTFTVSLSFPGK